VRRLPSTATARCKADRPGDISCGHETAIGTTFPEGWEPRRNAQRSPGGPQSGIGQLEGAGHCVVRHDDTPEYWVAFLVDDEPLCFEEGAGSDARVSGQFA
jgi:hypothetical protein